MKNFLSKKWFGPLILFLYTLCVSLFWVYKINLYMEKASPIITQEANNFLPITLQNGEITQPENAFIHKTYTFTGGKTFHIILDTRTDKLDLRTLPNTGFFVSKKCWYTVSPEETKVKCMEPDWPEEPLVITEDLIKDWMGKAEKYAGVCLGVCLTLILFIGMYFAILIYTVIMHWVIALSFKTGFGQTLFINTLTYMLCNLLEIATPISIGFLLKIILFICINVIICKTVNEGKQKENL